MTERDLRFAFVSSTAGSVMHEVLKNQFVRFRTHVVIVDHEGRASESAARHGVPAVTVAEDSEAAFCTDALKVLESNSIDFVFSFYEKFYTAEIRDAYRDRILNFHPSLLPAFKGSDGFGATIAYPARFAGNTIEFIGDVMDEGKIIMQTVCPIDPTVATAEIRHRIFTQQCQGLIQVAHWLQEGRVVVDGHRVIVTGANFDCATFSPALDAHDAKEWAPPALPSSL